MGVCTFFGEPYCPEAVRPDLEELLEIVISCHGIDRFYVGELGQFNGMVWQVLRKLRQKHPHIRCAVIPALAFVSGDWEWLRGYDDVLIPDVAGKTHPRYAIHRRNLWMLEQADLAIIRCAHCYGYAAKLDRIARKKGIVTVKL